MIKYFDNDFKQPVALQTIVQNERKDDWPLVKFLKNEINSLTQKIFLCGNGSKYYGELVSVADNKDLDSVQRLKSKINRCSSIQIRKII